MFFHKRASTLKYGAGTFKVGTGKGVAHTRFTIRKGRRNEHAVGNGFGSGSRERYHLNIRCY
jgi:hypothetical protein